MVKVSVVIPVYNVEEYLCQALDSCINQTLKDIEIICVDDGSTDKSLQILKEYSKKDERIKVFEQENQGSAIARNKALDIAQGEYIMFLDPDDWFISNACELAYNQISKNKNDFVIFAYNKYFETSNTFKEAKRRIIPFKDLIDEPHINLSQVQSNTLVNCNIWVQIYAKSFLDNNNIRFPNLRCTQDLPFVVECWLKAADISILNECIYNYRVRNGSMTFSTKNYLDRIKAREMAFQEVIKSDSINLRNAYFIHYIRSLRAWFYKIPYSQFKLKKEYYNCMRKVYIMLKNQYYNDFIAQHIKPKFFEFVCKNNFNGFLLSNIVNFSQNIFSIKNSKNKKHKNITILGLKISIKRKNG